MIDFSPYEAKRRNVTDQYGATGAKNAYAQFLSKTRGQRDLKLMQEQYGRKAPDVVGSYVRRGLAGPNVSSGIYSKGLSDFAIQAQRDQQDLIDQMNGQQTMFDLSEAEREAQYRGALADIESEKAREIRNVASTLTSFSPFWGG
jgi:hypothetical protein